MRLKKEDITFKNISAQFLIIFIIIPIQLLIGKYIYDIYINSQYKLQFKDIFYYIIAGSIIYNSIYWQFTTIPQGDINIFTHEMNTLLIIFIIINLILLITYNKCFSIYYRIFVGISVLTCIGLTISFGGLSIISTSIIPMILIFFIKIYFNNISPLLTNSILVLGIIVSYIPLFIYKWTDSDFYLFISNSITDIFVQLFTFGVYIYTQLIMTILVFSFNQKDFNEIFEINSNITNIYLVLSSYLIIYLTFYNLNLFS